MLLIPSAILSMSIIFVEATNRQKWLTCNIPLHLELTNLLVQMRSQRILIVKGTRTSQDPDGGRLVDRSASRAWPDPVGIRVCLEGTDVTKCLL